MGSPNRRKSRLLVLPAIGIIAIAFSTANLVLMIKDIHSTDLKISTFKGSAAAAASLNGLAIVAITFVCISHVGDLKPRWIFKAIFGWIGALVAIAAAIITLNVIILRKINPDLVYSTDAGHAISPNVEIAIWTLSTLVGLVFFLTFGFLSSSQNQIQSPDSSAPLSPLTEKKYQRNAPERPPTPPTPFRLTTNPYMLPEDSTHLPAPPQINSRRSSWRDSLASLHQVVRLQQSKQRLLHSQTSTARSSFSKDARSITSLDTKSLSNSIRSDAIDFAPWDLNAPETQIRDTLASSSISRKPTHLQLGTTLETIPGSQPASPAKPLDAFVFPVQQPQHHQTCSLDYEAEDTLTSFEHFRSCSRASDRNFNNLERTAHALGRPITILSASTITLPDNLPDRPPTSMSSHSRFDSAPSLIRPSTNYSTQSRIDTSPNLPRPSTAMSSHSLRKPVNHSRPTTPSLAEAHIHPLFRTDSPTPPPNTSVNTTVVASPFSGQVIGQLAGQPASLPPYGAVPRPYASRDRSRSGSRGRGREDGRSTPISFHYVASGSHVGYPESGRSTPVANGSRPIPDYILSASKERII